MIPIAVMTNAANKPVPAPSISNPANAARAVNAPAMTTSPWENLMTLSTPKNSVNPTATME